MSINSIRKYSNYGFNFLKSYATPENITLTIMITLIALKIIQEIRKQIIHSKTIHIGNLTGEGFVEALKNGAREFKGNINAQSYQGPISLPENLKICGDLFLNSTTIQELPKIEVGRNLSLSSSPLQVIHEGVKVGGDLFLLNCKSLEKIPKDLQVGGCLYLKGCTSLKGNELSIPNLGPLSKSCKKHKITMREIKLSDEDIERLRAEAESYGNIELIFDTKDSQRPLTYTGDLTGEGFVEQLNQGIMEFKGNITAFGYKGQIPLIEGLKIHGDLFLNSTTIQKLPKIEVDGDLSLSSSSLQVIHEGVKVGGSLFLLNCESLEKIPKDLQVGYSLYLKGCTSLKGNELSIPNLGPLGRGCEKHLIAMQGIKLPDEDVERLKAEAAALKNIELQFSKLTSQNNRL